MSFPDEDSDSIPTEGDSAPTLSYPTVPTFLPVSISDLISDLSDSSSESPSGLSLDSSPGIPMDLANLSLPIPDLIQTDVAEQVIADVKQGPPNSGFSPRLGNRAGKTGSPPMAIYLCLISNQAHGFGRGAKKETYLQYYGRHFPYGSCGKGYARTIPSFGPSAVTAGG